MTDDQPGKSPDPPRLAARPSDTEIKALHLCAVEARDLILSVPPRRFFDSDYQARDGEILKVSAELPMGDA